MKAEPIYLKTKICIIGAGPGGATTSLYLSRFGIPHVVIDKAEFPRDKVCGESFDGRVCRILADLCPDSLSKLHQEQTLLETWNYQFHSKKIDLAVAFPKSSLPRLSAQREQLDAFLFDQMQQSAMAKVFTGYSIRAVEPQDAGMRILGDGICIDAELVVRASGAHFGQGKGSSLFVFSRRYYEGLENAGEKGLEVFYFDQPVPGCLFLCPLSRHRYNIEIGVQRKAYQNSALNMDALQEAYVQSRPELHKRFAKARALGKRKGTFMHLQTKVRWAETGVIQVGSSAFCVNPITGLGVGNAMSMGKLAAEKIRDFYMADDVAHQAIAQYQKAAKKKYRSILWMNKIVNLVQAYFPWFEPALAGLLNLSFVQRLLLKQDLVKGFSVRKFYRKLRKELAYSPPRRKL